MKYEETKEKPRELHGDNCIRSFDLPESRGSQSASPLSGKQRIRPVPPADKFILAGFCGGGLKFKA